jgi:hypothetical protein
MAVCVNYFILVIWFPLWFCLKDFFITALTIPPSYLLELFKNVLIANFRDHFSLLYPKLVNVMFGLFLQEGLPIDLFTFYTASCILSLLRLAISIVFVGSFLLRPLVMHPISLVWARIVESDKPVFTVMFGGAAAFATAITEAAKHLWS